MIARAIDSLKQVKLAMTNFCFPLVLASMLSTPVIAAQIAPQPSIPAPANPALADMQDIIAPEAISTSPSAPGYYISAVLVIVLVLSIILTLLKRRKRLAPLKQAIFQISQLDSTASINDISSLIKRVLLSYLPREAVAPLSGERWLSFLKSQLTQKQGANFDFQSFANLLGQGYQKSNLTPQETEQLKQLSCQWLALALPSISKRGHAKPIPKVPSQAHASETSQC